MDAVVRPLLLPGAHALGHLADLLDDALDRWRRNWLRSPDAVDGVTATVHDAPIGTAADAWTEWSTAAGRVWIRTTPVAEGRVAMAVLGHAPGDAFAGDVLRDAIVERDRCVAVALLGDAPATWSRPPAAGLTAFGSGTRRPHCRRR